MPARKYCFDNTKSWLSAFCSLQQSRAWPDTSGLQPVDFSSAMMQCLQQATENDLNPLCVFNMCCCCSGWALKCVFCFSVPEICEWFLSFFFFFLLSLAISPAAYYNLLTDAQIVGGRKGPLGLFIMYPAVQHGNQKKWQTTQKVLVKQIVLNFLNL